MASRSVEMTSTLRRGGQLIDGRQILQTNNRCDRKNSRNCCDPTSAQFAAVARQPQLVLWCLVTVVFSVAIGDAIQAEEPAAALKVVGRLPESIREASGLCKSRQHEGVFWTHSDSGNAPLLFAITRTGELLATYRVKGAVNLDWESIETDDNGRLYVCDVGNNLPGGPLKTRWIDIVREPDPRAKPVTDPDGPRELAIERQQHFTFPDQAHDVEGVVRTPDALLLFGKVREAPAPIFALSFKANEAARTSKPVLLRTLGTVSATRITGAALTSARDRLALCTYDRAWLFELRADEDFQQIDRRLVRTIRFAPTQIEGCEWDGDRLLLVSEDRSLYEIVWPKPRNEKITP